MRGGRDAPRRLFGRKLGRDFGRELGLVLLAASFITDFVLMAMGLGNLDAAGKDALKRAGTVNSLRGEIEK